VLGTDAFAGLAEAAAASLGMPHLQLAAVAHPIGGIDPKLVAPRPRPSLTASSRR